MREFELTVDGHTKYVKADIADVTEKGAVNFFRGTTLVAAASPESAWDFREIQKQPQVDSGWVSVDDDLPIRGWTVMIAKKETYKVEASSIRVASYVRRMAMLSDEGLWRDPITGVIFENVVAWIQVPDYDSPD